MAAENAPSGSNSDAKALRKELDEFTKGMISGQSIAGQTPTQISRNLNVPQTTVQGVLERLKESHTGANKPRSGRPKVIDARAQRLLVRAVQKKPNATWKELKETTGLDRDTRNLERALKARGIVRQKKASRNLLGAPNATAGPGAKQAKHVATTSK